VKESMGGGEVSIIDEAEDIGREEAKSRHEEEIDLAKEALKRADAQELFKFYEEAVKERENLLVAMDVLARHRSGKAPRYQPGEDIIQSMERVALAAIELAKGVALKAE